jgi:hypothetical protein
MCLLAIFYRVVDDAPLVVGANREEMYARPSELPHILDGPSRAVAGIDKLAGGTWLGVNQRGLLVAVTNRMKTRPVAQPRSRGLLAREMLECRSAQESIELATRELDMHRYLGCNVVCADSDRVVVFQAGDWLRIKMIPPGLHVLTNEDINDGRDPRLGYALDFLSQQPYETSFDCIQALRQLCRHRGGDGTPPICLRGELKGTVSSTLVVLRKSLGRSIYLHAPGPPDQTGYEDFSPLLEEIGK